MKKIKIPKYKTKGKQEKMKLAARKQMQLKG